jgi:hypothetical protein
MHSLFGNYVNIIARLLTPLALIVIFGLTPFLHACKPPQSEERNFNANFKITIKDPLVQELARVTQRLHVTAAGDLNPGNYRINNIPINVQPGTKFAFEFALPVEPGGVVSTGNATGRLTTTIPLQVFGIATPKLVALKDGKATAEVNLLRAFGNFFCNLLQDQFLTSRTDDIKKMFKNVTVSSAVLAFIPDSTLHFDKHQFHLAGGSKIELVGLNVSGDLDYTGKCIVDLHFASNSAYQGKKVDTKFQGGTAHIVFDAERKQGLLTMKAAPNQSISLNDCVFVFGKGKDSTMKCSQSDILLKAMNWSKKEDSVRSEMHMTADSRLEKAHLDYNGKKFGLDATFKRMLPVTLNIDKGEDGDSVEFSTDKGVMADIAQLDIMRKTTNISMLLNNVHLGPITMTKSGQFDLALEKGTSGVTSFDWKSGKKSFNIKTAGPAELSVTPGMSLVLSTADGATSGKLPLNIRLGSATLKSQNGFMDLRNVKGNLTIDIDTEVAFDSNLDFSIAQSSFLGDHSVNVQARGLSLVTKNGETTASLDHCTVAIPEKEISEVIDEQTPDEKTFDVNIKVYNQQKWRFRNLVVTKVIIKDPSISDIQASKEDQFGFATTGDLTVEGTVEKAGLAAVVFKHVKFENRPWSAKAKAKGTGTVTYKVLPNKCLADTKVHYNLAMKMPLPDDVDLDWSGVSEGIVRKTEETIITAILKRIKPFKGGRIMPLNYSGDINMFGKSQQPILKSISISGITSEPAQDGIKVRFSAQAKL